MEYLSVPTLHLRKILDIRGIEWYDKTVVTKKDDSKSKMQYKEVHLEKTSFCLNGDQITGFVGYGKYTDDTYSWFNYGVQGDPEEFICFKIFNSNHENEYEYVYGGLHFINEWIEDRVKGIKTNGRHYY